MNRQPAIIFDRDGTLASVKYIAPTTRDDGAWAAFNAALPFDAPVPEIVALCRSIRPGVTRIMTSGRMAGDRPGDVHRWYAMRAWLDKHNIPIDLLFMRDGGDTRRDSIVKAEMYRRHIEPYYDVRYVVDDRPEVCDMWESLGLQVLRVVDPDIEPPIAAKAGIWDVIDHVKSHADGAVIAQSDQIDIQRLLEEGWTYDGNVTVIEGKRIRILNMPVLCPGTGRPWGSGTGSPICPVCHRGPNTLNVRRPVRRSGRWSGKVPNHPPRTA